MQRCSKCSVFELVYILYVNLFFVYLNLFVCLPEILWEELPVLIKVTGKRLQISDTYFTICFTKRIVSNETWNFELFEEK